MFRRCTHTGLRSVLLLTVGLTLLAAHPRAARGGESFDPSTLTYQADGFYVGPDYGWDIYWTSLGLKLGFFDKDGFLVGVAGGIQWHLADQSWDWSPAFGGGYGNGFIGYAFDDTVGLLAMGGVRMGGLLSSGGNLDGGQILADDAMSYMARLFVPVMLDKSRRDRGTWNLMLVPSLNLKGVETPFREQTLPKREYDKEVELVLVGSRPLERDEVKSLTVGLSTDLVFDHARKMSRKTILGDALSFGLDYLHNVDGGDSFFMSAQNDFFVGFFPYSFADDVSPVDAWLELHARLGGQYVFGEDTPMYLLPSLGGEYAMVSVKRGTYANLREITAAFELGPSFARGFVEAGWTGGIGPSSSLVGGGLILSFPRAMMFMVSDESVLHGALFGGTKMVLAGTSEGFVAQLLMGGVF